MIIRLGRNPYGEWVEESPQGVRRVATPQGWKQEGELPCLRFCRWLTPTDKKLAIQSLSDFGILKSFNSRPSCAFSVWNTKPNQPTQLNPEFLDKIEKRANPNWVDFQQNVEKAWAKYALHRLVQHQGWSPKGPKWDWVIHTPLDQFSLGLWWGLAHRLVKMQQLWEEKSLNNPFWVWEIGLNSSDEASTRLISPPHRHIFTEVLSTHRTTPRAQVKIGYASPPSFRKSFNPKKVAHSSAQIPDPTHVILWITQKALKTHGDPSSWLDWLKDNSGWVIFDRSAESIIFEKKLGTLLASIKRIPTRYFILDTHGKITHHIWMCEKTPGLITPTQISLLDFAGSPPPLVIDTQGPMDDAGRVLYRPGNPHSKAEGYAPQRLEAGMHHALNLIWDSPDEVQKNLEKALGMPFGEITKRLSAEQIDAILLAKKSLHEGGGFVLSDETGFGKGRTLASLARLGLSEGRTVVFITENANLFSDLHRDLLATGEPILPTLLHQDATIRNPDGVVYAKSVNGEAFKDLMKSKKWKEGEPRFIMTTYAQLGRAMDENPSNKKSKSKKLKEGEFAKNYDPSDGKLSWLRSRMNEGAWLLLDEAHNAAGNSQINERLEKLIKNAGGVVFASATYARKEDNLGVYTNALPLDKWTRNLLHQALENDEGVLRETLTTAMAQAGRLVRREHPPVPPPQPLWVPVGETLQSQVDAFGAFWRYLFRAGELAEQMNGEQTSVWMKLGGLLSRSIREFSMWAKNEYLLEFIEEKIKANEKVVIALESTMESALKETLLDISTSDEEGEDGKQTVIKTRLKLKDEPLWKDRWRKILNEWIPQEMLNEAYKMGENFNEQLNHAYQSANQALDNCPNWGLSPLDSVQKRLSEKGIRSGELSGRHNQLSQDQDGQWVLSGRTKASMDRQGLVRSFNEGEIDVIWITRAGCAGISLHAGEKFKDQRKRNLIEWDIPVNPANRVQFWGRVRRKDQVCEPDFWGLALDIPLERRRLEREERKRKWLAAHAGTTTDQSLDLPWLSPEGEVLIAEWALLYPKPARRIGVHLPQLDNPTGRIDRALLRAIILTPPVQKSLWDYLEEGLKWVKDWSLIENEQLSTHPSKVIRSQWWWGDPLGVEDGRLGALDCPRVDVVERIWAPKSNPNLEEMKKELTQALKEGKNGIKLLEYFQSKPCHLLENESQFASQTLPLLSPGSGFEFSRPGTGEIIRAVVLRVHTPAHSSVLKNGPHLTGLSQYGIQIWATGENKPWWIPLSKLAQDPFFKSLGRAKMDWFSVPTAPLIGLTLEGNSILAAAWGQRWNSGRALLISDVDEGLKSVWTLPRSWSWKDMQALPRDLLDVDHLLSFWKEYPDDPVYAALPGHESWIAQPIQGGVCFSWSLESYEIAKKKWLPYQVDRKLGYPQKKRGSMERHVSFKDLRLLLHSWAVTGLGWRIDSKFAPWHKKSAIERMQSQRLK